MIAVFTVYTYGVIHIVRTHVGGGEGVAKKRMFAYKGGRGVLLGQVRTHAKNFFALLQVFERPQISDIQKHDKNNTFHNEYFLL